MFNAVFKAVVSSSLVAAAPLPPTHQDKNPFIPSKLRVFYSSPGIDDEGTKPPVPILLEESGGDTPQVDGLEYNPEDKTLLNNIPDSDIGDDIPSVFVALAPGHASPASAGLAEDDDSGVVNNEGMPKVQARTLRNEDESNMSETTSDRKSERNQTADTTTMSDPSLDFGILDRNWATPNDRELDGLGCNGNHPSIPAEVDFADLIGDCLDSKGLDSNSCPFKLPIDCWNVSLVTDMSKTFFDTDYGFNPDISAWDVSSVTNMERMFNKAEEFNQPVNSWDVSSVTSMYKMFDSAYAFNQPVDSWDVSSVTSMERMFQRAVYFNQPVDSWDVSSVTRMDRMFYDEFSFNQTVDSWEVSSVTSMDRMFLKASDFNQPVDSWDVSSVTSMDRMFDGAYEFNQPVDSWDVSSVPSMYKMFKLAYAFNQPVDSWDVSSVTSMERMFYGAYVFNQPVDSWDVSSVNSMKQMFYAAFIFNQPVDSWDVSSVNSMRNMFYLAYEFNQCLSTWADKVSPAVDTRNIFEGSSCPNIGSPDPNGPWCQDADVCPNDPNDCENNPAPFSLQTSCEEIATLLPKTINQLCDIGIAKDCPELCPGNETCPCADFILPFSFKDETISCTEVAGLKESKQEKKCRKKKIAENCPGVCTCGTF